MWRSGRTLALIAFFGGTACAAQDAPSSYSAAELADGWAISSLEVEGLSPAGIEDVVEFIEQDSHGDFRSLLIARNGRLVFEGYFNGHGPDSLHDIRSATKSITSALVGIAISDGVIDGLREPVVALFPEYEPYENDDAWKRAITLEQLLTMSSGLHADVSDSSSPGHEDRMWESDDWVRFALDLPMAGAPGRVWSYASVNTFLAGALLEQSARRRLASYAEDLLFEPMGITSYRWAETPAGRTVAQGNLSLRARDMAKIGQLYLDAGRWATKQIVPQAWVRESTEPRYPVPWDGYDAYGYGWYTHTLPAGGRDIHYFIASGNGGNKIYVLPGERMVVAIQSAAYNTDYGQERSLKVLRKVLAATLPLAR